MTVNILYICTHNRCRSILSEAITNHLSNGTLRAFSAGSQPVGEVHPLSIRYLKEKGIETSSLKSQSWDDFEEIRPDIVITVCDSAANEPCPMWFGETTTIHWGLPDPSKLNGTDAEIRQAFLNVMASIEHRVKQLLELRLEDKTAKERGDLLNTLIGRIDGTI